MIYGIGSDIIALARFEKLYGQYGNALAKRILSPQEYDEFSGSLKQPARWLAKRFAAKEAFAKAVGTGLRAPVSLRNISITHNPLGKPEFCCAPELQTWLAERQIQVVHLSLSDEQDTILAFAVAAYE